MSTYYDVIIVGGGVVGTGLALGLRASHLRIALVDARLSSANDARLFALNEASCNFLKNVGLWSQLEPDATAIKEVNVTRRGHFGSVRLKSKDVGLSSLGHVIPAHLIEAAMNANLDHLTQYRPAKLIALDSHDHHAEITLKTETDTLQLQSPLIIGADGTDSTVRRLLAIETDEYDYQQTAIVTRTCLQRAHHHVAHERFVASGAIAMLPLQGQECATIWTADNRLAQQLLSASDEEFLQQLQQHFGYRLGRIMGVKKRLSYPLRQVKAKEYKKDYVYLLGNAAHTLHPIAALGFNLALYEVASLVASLTKTGLSDFSVTKQQHIGLEVSHRLAQLFTKDSLLSQLAIHLGMGCLDLCTPAKRKFITGLLGKTGPVPPLLLDMHVP